MVWEDLNNDANGVVARDIPMSIEGFRKWSLYLILAVLSKRYTQSSEEAFSRVSPKDSSHPNIANP